MARLDPILDRLFREQGLEAQFESGTTGTLRTRDSEKPLFKMSLTAPQIITAFAEIVPAEQRAAFPPEGPFQFSYQGTLGMVQIRFEKGNGIVRASITPGQAAGAAAPAPARGPGEPAQVVPIRPTAGTAMKGVGLQRPRDPRQAMEELLRHMLAKKASDLHLSSQTVPMLRVDGSIEPISEWGEMSNDDLKEMLWTITPDRNKNQWEDVKDTDFAHETDRARFRVNCFADRKGIGSVMRQIPAKIMTAEEMGLSKAVIDLCFLTKGLVLVTGPTGSGKSTTLAAIVDYINRFRDDHIITIEDPIEFVHPNKKCLVNQREIGVHTGSFKHALRAALREDPDIVLVGEMRDLETIAIAIETAETGHLVFGTLHTNTAPSTVDRVIDQFPTDRQAQIRVMLSESLKAVVAQTLCKKIGGGRVPALEILMVSSAVANLIREGKTFQILSSMQTGRNQGMQTMNDALLELVKKKIVEPKEAYMKSIHKGEMLKALELAGHKVDLQGGMIQAFTKVEGLSNDFVLLDARPAPIALDPARAIALCDRHRGIGADGVLVIGPSKKAAARLEIWNADGSRAEMCGNGLRCAALLLLGELEVAEIKIETAAGLHRCRLAGAGAQDARAGSPGEVWVELVGLQIGKSETLEVPGPRGEPISLSGRRVSLGNPHFVVFGGADTNRAAQLGPAIERNRAFGPQRTNVEFCELPSQNGSGVPAPALRVRVWERGAGLTLACGTGAAAAAAAAWTDGHLPREATLVELPGGTVRVEPVSEKSVGLTGAARLVFRGQIDL